MFTNILEFIGGCFIVAAVVGAVVPGWNFHAVFASDKEAKRWHERHAEELATRIEDKEKEK